MAVELEWFGQLNKLSPPTGGQQLREERRGRFFLPVTSEQQNFLIYRLAGIGGRT